MSTNVETAFIPGYKPEVLPIYGCSSKCELYPHICWRDKFAARSACENCRAGTPHVHWDRITRMHKMRVPRVFSGHMGEISDLDKQDIYRIMGWADANHQHLFHIFSHQPDFFRSISLSRMRLILVNMKIEINSNPRRLPPACPS